MVFLRENFTKCEILQCRLILQKKCNIVDDNQCNDILKQKLDCDGASRRKSSIIAISDGLRRSSYCTGNQADKADQLLSGAACWHLSRS